MGSFDLETPRDRNGTFEPQLVKKRQTILNAALDEKILALFCLGMSYDDISKHLADLYGVEISKATISAITDKLIPIITEWRSRPLETTYPIIFLDAMFFKAREENKVIQKAIYMILGINQQGHKDVLGFYAAESEGANFWLGVLNDLKTVYTADTKDLAEQNLLMLDEKWGEKYPIVLKSWQIKWDYLSAYFKYTKPVRRLIYTTNPIEGFHRQVRKYTKSKGAFTSENALFKLIYAAVMQIKKKWTLPIRDWALTISQLDIYFSGRLNVGL